MTGCGATLERTKHAAGPGADDGIAVVAVLEKPDRRRFGLIRNGRDGRGTGRNLRLFRAAIVYSIGEPLFCAA